MTDQDVIAQLNQDITTAENAGDEDTANRLRRELQTALREVKDPQSSAGSD
ncbi:hypothetical protein [Nocardia sp. NPDC024068]|uniref:hypothetical protein n=1 Tax=Nocardia sp. NPDC024068 TaxID=3157197 RepID=UPI0033C3892A